MQRCNIKYALNKEEDVENVQKEAANQENITFMLCIQ